MATKATLDRIYDAANEITERSHDIAAIARALNRVGLTTLADEIGEIGAAVGNAAAEVRSAYGAEVSAAFARTEQATANMVLAALAVASAE